jgi:hypothetical protein
MGFTAFSKRSIVGRMRFKVGQSYLHQNGHFIRTIDAIIDDVIYWHDHVAPGQCSAETFHRQTGQLLTPEETAILRAGNVLPPRVEPSEAIRKFASICRDAKRQKSFHIVINSAHELGLTYEDVMKNLELLKSQGLYLRIIPD